MGPELEEDEGQLWLLGEPIRWGGSPKPLEEEGFPGASLTIFASRESNKEVCQGRNNHNLFYEKINKSISGCQKDSRAPLLSPHETLTHTASEV